MIYDCSPQTAGYYYYIGTSCQGGAYLPVTNDILNNSKSNPYSLGPGENGDFFGPNGTPQRGQVLGNCVSKLL